MPNRMILNRDRCQLNNRFENRLKTTANPSHWVKHNFVVFYEKADPIVVVHLSATAIHTVIGQIHSAQDIRIIGFIYRQNHDFAQGTIRHRERLKSAIKQSIQNAEDMANCRVNSVWLVFLPQIW